MTRYQVDPGEAYPSADGPAGKYGYSRRIVGQVEVTHPSGETTVHHTDLAGHGLYPASLRHPDDVPAPMYHGTPRDIPEGAQIEPGHPGNFVRRMTHVYMTTDPDEARKYAGPEGTVYQVQPTGFYGHRRDARGTAWASGDPLDITGRHE
ncbi:MAG TPA: hypothetical protein VFO01_11495 [Trebonia sp.]|nr:hypothetical protein [Trebonia sp.]